MAAERVRNRIDKERLVRAYEAHKQDYLAIADNLRIKHEESFTDICDKIGLMRHHVEGETTSKLMKK